MWADVKLRFTDMLSTKFPEGTDIIRIIYKNHYYGFNLKTGLSDKISPSVVSNYFPGHYLLEVNPSTILDEQFQHIYVAQGLDNTIEFTLEFMKAVDDSTEDPENINKKRWEVITSIDFAVDSKNQVENGYKYDVSGKIPDADSNTQAGTISIVDFHSEEIFLNFN